MSSAHTQSAYNSHFAALATSLRSNGWECRQESQSPTSAYLHVSRPSWNDENLDGIHLETYVLSPQLVVKEAVVALHCEGGWPTSFRKMFVKGMSERIAPKIDEWNDADEAAGKQLGRWKLMEPTGMSVCEVKVPFGNRSEDTMDRIRTQLGRLMEVANWIDEAIAECQRNVKDNEGNVNSNFQSFPRSISQQEVLQNDGQNWRSLWAVIDGYVVDATKLVENHPGGPAKLLSVNEASSGWTGKPFGFSLARGPNAHFAKTANTFQAGVDEFETLGRTEVVSVNYSSYGSITILGNLID